MTIEELQKRIDQLTEENRLLAERLAVANDTNDRQAKRIEYLICLKGTDKCQT